MTDKERLERIIQMQYDGYTIWDMSEDDLIWLIEQVQKLETTMDFYQSALRDADRRVHELELELNDWREEVQKWQKFYKESEERHLETKELLKSIIKQNKRYREYLELIRISGTHGRIISTGEIIRSDEANLAEEALEGEDYNE